MALAKFVLAFMSHVLRNITACLNRANAAVKRRGLPR